MSAAEMREAALFCKPCPFCGGIPEYERVGTARQSMIIVCQDCGARVESSDVAGLMPVESYHWNRRAPLPDEEGMVERVARAMCFAWHYAKPRTPDGEAEWARERSRLMAQARAALHVINGGAEGGEARQHIEALLSLHIAHHNNPIHGAARAFLSKREAK